MPVLCLYSSDKQKMLPKELDTSKAKHKQEAERVRKMNPEEKAATNTKLAEQ